MARIISFVSGKGGVGKTTLVSNIGITLNRMGQKVLLIDTDVAMANLSLMLGMESSPITINDVLKGEANISDVIYKGPDGINVIPASLSLQDFKNLDLSRMPSLIKTLSSKYDFILLDAPAGVGEDTLASMASSTEVFLVVNPYSLSIADSLKTKITAQKINAKPVGLILNMSHAYKGEISEEDIVKMMELPSYGNIPYDEEIRKTFFAKKIQPVVVRNQSSESATAFKVVSQRILGQEVSLVKKKRGFFDWLFRR